MGEEDLDVFCSLGRRILHAADWFFFFFFFPVNGSSYVYQINNMVYQNHIRLFACHS